MPSSQLMLTSRSPGHRARSSLPPTWQSPVRTRYEETRTATATTRLGPRGCQRVGTRGAVLSRLEKVPAVHHQPAHHRHARMLGQPRDSFRKALLVGGRDPQLASAYPQSAARGR